MNILAQIISGMGTASNIIGINLKDKLKCLIFFIIGNSLVALSLGMMNAYSGMIVQITFVIETIINYFLERKNEKFQYPIWLIIMYIMIPCIINIFYFSSVWDIFPIAASILFPLAILSKGTKLRVLNLVSVAVWIPYNMAFAVYVAVVSCSIFTIMNFMAIVRYDIIKKEKAN